VPITSIARLVRMRGDGRRTQLSGRFRLPVTEQSCRPERSWLAAAILDVTPGNLSRVSLAPPVISGSR
jgi:hypothetical protein